MRLLVDTDAFCKLAAVGLLEEAAKLLGGTLSEVERLAALPHMLRGSKKLRKHLGDALADELVPIAMERVAASAPPTDTATLLVGVENIDVGEVELFASAASADALLVSGDKRALNAVARVVHVVPRLSGKIVCLEAMLFALCDSVGVEQLRSRVSSRAYLDKVFQICFSPGSAPKECLGSYLRDLQSKVVPLVLWSPPGGT
ncbi:MAG: hypothetical protein JNG84_11275 [Archangium sp.]|nr:hypothetical protein [Archangium sp.]